MVIPCQDSDLRTVVESLAATVVGLAQRVSPLTVQDLHVEADISDEVDNGHPASPWLPDSPSAQSLPVQDCHAEDSCKHLSRNSWCVEQYPGQWLVDLAAIGPRKVSPTIQNFLEHASLGP